VNLLGNSFVGRIIRGHVRLWTALICGLIQAWALPAQLSTPTRAVLSWDIGVIIFLALNAVLFLSEGHQRIARDAARVQEGEWTIFGLTIAAAAFSLVAVLGEYAALKDAHGATRTLPLVLVATTLLVSWLMVHTTFGLRYAHEFYSHDSSSDTFDGGLRFPGEDTPDYLDFIYFALVLGMTFQVSDVQITTRKMRRLATLHGLLSFLFSTIIIALSVNLAAGLV
jgi:uncharacterized membrane protein